MQNPVHTFETVGPRFESKHRFMAELIGHRTQVLLIDIRRIADDQVVLSVRQRGEKIGLNRLDAILKTVPVDIDCSDSQCIGRDIDSIDHCIRECVRNGDRNAATARAEIQGMAHTRCIQPGRKFLRHELRDRAARYQDAFIDVEFEPRKPGLLQQVRERHALPDTGFSNLVDLCGVLRTNIERVRHNRVLMHQLEYRKYQPGGLVQGIVGAMSIGELRLFKACGNFSNVVFNVHQRARIYHARWPSALELPACSQANLIKMHLKQFLIALLLGSSLAIGIFVATKPGEPVKPVTALLIPKPDPLPDFSLLDQFGRPVSADSFRGQWDLVFFGFTHCPDICPTTMQTLANSKKALIDAGIETIPRIVLVSVDPERDTPAALKKYVEYIGDDNLGVTGDLEEMRKLTKGLGIYFEKVKTTDENYNVDHSAVVIVVDPQARFAALFSAPHKVEQFLHDYPIIVAEQ